MTLPVQHGYPDFGRYQARADVVLAYETNTVLTQAVERGPYFVGGVSHLGVLFSCFGQHVIVGFRWWADAALTTQLGEYQVEQRAGTAGFDFSIPVAGPWLTVIIEPLAFNATILFRLWTVAGPLAMSTGLLSPDHLIAIEGNVNAGATSTTVAVETAPGMASFHADSILTAFRVILESITASGNVTRIAKFDARTPLATVLVFLPALTVQVRRINDTAANGEIAVSVVRSGLGMIGHT